MDKHLIDLEIKISHQEVAIESLQQAVHDQQMTIAKLEKSLKNLTDRFEANIAPEIGPANQNPPHY
jgi:uncharacterized coiled-coil protein SlyX